MINAEADEGAVVLQEKIKIEYEDDAKTLYDKILSVGVKQEIKFTEDFENGRVVLIPQNPSEGNSWRKRGKADG